MAKRLPANWDFIFPLYRTGLSPYEIARQYEATHVNSKKYKPTVTEAAIRDYAKRHKWSRDLEKTVKERTADKLLRAGLREKESAKLSDSEIVEQAAEVRIQHIEIQRSDLQALRRIEADITERFEQDEKQTLVGWYEGAASEHKVKMGLLERCRAYFALSQARVKRIICERLVLGIDAKEDYEKTRAGVAVYLNLSGDKETE